MEEFEIGKTVKYTFYGKAETSKIARIGGNGALLFLENGRWMHTESCTLVPFREIPLVFPEVGHLAGLYDGPVKHLRLQRAMLMPADDPNMVKAQFDQRHLPEAFGWHEFPRRDFVNIEGEGYGHWPR